LTAKIQSSTIKLDTWCWYWLFRNQDLSVEEARLAEIMAKLKKWGQKVTVSDRLNLDKDADENNTKIGDIIGDDTEQKKGDPRLLHQLTDGTKFLSISFD